MSTEKPSASNEKPLSDPCQVPVVDKVTGKKRICGHVTRSLAPHLKVHNTPSMKPSQKWNRKRYEKEFPTFSLGQRIYVPTEEHLAKLTKGRTQHNENVAKRSGDLADSSVPAPPDDEETGGSGKYAEFEARLTARKNELWDQVNRDVAAEQFAEEAARAEFRIKEVNRRYDAAFARGDYDRCKKLMDELIRLQTVLKSQMDFLDMNVKSRRARGGLGNDTVAQLISNFGGTVRRWSPERRETFDNRVKEVRRSQAERIREKLLSQILEETITEVVPREESETDYDEKLQQFVERSES